MNPDRIVASLAALAQGTRLAIYRQLVEAGPPGISVGEIGAPLQIAPATLSFHLKELLRAGLITARQEGRFIFYVADYAHMREVMAYLDENCCRGTAPAREPEARCCAPATDGRTRPKRKKGIDHA